MTSPDPVIVTQSVTSLPIAYALKAALVEAGYKDLNDLYGISIGDLATELSIPPAQAEELLDAVAQAKSGSFGRITLKKVEGADPEDVREAITHQTAPSSPIKPSTAAELLSSSASNRFSTHSLSLDRLIAQYSPSMAHDRSHGITDPKRLWQASRDGAIVPGMSVEISGPPGAGKSVLAMALAINARLAENEKNSAEVLIVDTEGGITPYTLRARALSATNGSQPDAVRVLQGIHLVRIPTQVQMVAFLHLLDEWVDDHPKVRLIIIDTLSYHFRHPNMDTSSRRRVMDMVKHKIGRITTVNRCAVVITSQLATKLLTMENKPANFETGDRAVLMPQLGESWTTSKTLRLVLFRGGRGDDLRYAHASSSGAGDEDSPWARFDIDADGVPCDLADDL